MKQQQKIVVGTVAITRGSRVPILNDGLLVVVVQIGHRMDINRYRIQSVTGQPLPRVGNQFYKQRTAKISAARLLPVYDAPHEPLSTGTKAMIDRALRAGGRETLASGTMMMEMQP
jgi:hypothetical protein